RLLPIPGVRAPARALLWWSVATAALAATAARSIARRAPSRRAWWSAVLVLACVIGGTATRGPIAQRAAAGALVALGAPAMIPRRVPHWPAVLVLAADLVVFGAEMHVGPRVAGKGVADLRRIRSALTSAVDREIALGRAIVVPAMADAMWAQIEQ